MKKWWHIDPNETNICRQGNSAKEHTSNSKDTFTPTQSSASHTSEPAIPAQWNALTTHSSHLYMQPTNPNPKSLLEAFSNAESWHLAILAFSRPKTLQLTTRIMCVKYRQVSHSKRLDWPRLEDEIFIHAVSVRSGERAALSRRLKE